MVELSLEAVDALAEIHGSSMGIRVTTPVSSVARGTLTTHPALKFMAEALRTDEYLHRYLGYFPEPVREKELVRVARFPTSPNFLRAKPGSWVRILSASHVAPVSVRSCYQRLLPKG